MVVPGQSRDLAGDGPAGALEGMDPDHPGQQRGPDHSTAAGARPLVECGEHAAGAVHAGDQVRDRHADLGRLGGAGDRHQPALALGDLVITGPRRLRAVVAEAGDRQHHQPWVELVQARDGEAEPVQHADTVVLHQHVGTFDQPRQHGPVVGLLEIEDDRLLVAVRRQEVRRLRAAVGPDERRSPAAGVVAGGRLHLDHPSPQVTEHHRGLRSGQGPGQVEHQQVGEGAGGHADSQPPVLSAARAEVHRCVGAA